jgi:hypothetical protein
MDLRDVSPNINTTEMENRGEKRQSNNSNK